jgi:peroxiredoxin Q/BCP
MTIKLPTELAKKSTKFTVVYFYPKDDTPGCTQEGKDFTTYHDELARLGAVVYGVSRDNEKSHEKFKCKYNFSFELISDTEEHLCKQFDVLQLKKNYGKEYIGIERSTFLFHEGKLVKEWRNVKVEGHAKAVLEEILLFHFPQNPLMCR